jgi:predicted DNA-binding transcriptional regulator YafY
MLAGAVWEQKRISMQYRTWNASGENEGVRVRDPLGLVLKGGEWYLVTRVRTQLRTYRVSSIAQLTVHDETFERPEDFDLRDEWTAAVASFETSLLKHTARLRLSPEGMTRLHRLGAAAVEQAQIAPPSEQDGWQEVTLPVEQLGYAAEQLLGLAGHVEVLDPPELRERLRKLGEQIATLNAG